VVYVGLRRRYSPEENGLSLAVVVLAAGQGTRMKSDLAKVLHPVGGKPMVARAVATAQRLAERDPVLIIGHEMEAVKAAVGNGAQYVIQGELLGTGHAVMQAESLLRGQADIVVVYYADMPLLTPETVQRLIDAQKANPGPITLLTIVTDPRGFGRIIRGADGSVIAVVEERDATPEQRQSRELNVGVYAFQADWLWTHLHKLTPHAKGEYYLTDMVELAVQENLPVIGIEGDDLDELIGINTRVHLSEAEAALRRRINQRWMLEGVTIIDPATTYIHDDAIIGRDTVIQPNTHIQGKTTIGSNCVIGPNTVIYESQIGNNCAVNSSVIEEAVIEERVHMGPFSHLRKGAYLGQGVHMGNFGEVKNSRLGPGTHMGHFSYIGDSEVGEHVNIGAGTITANFDGVNKNKTIIGDHAFIGSDTILRAPVTVEANAKTAAGSVVTRTVPEGHIAIGIPARMRKIEKIKDSQSHPLDNSSKDQQGGD
jgi:bifunctional UDP-N-acetylglucosamine pyrophosphorylase/glucosamine-1-phosphate N-acetyltransferase